MLYGGLHAMRLITLPLSSMSYLYTINYILYVLGRLSHLGADEQLLCV
jgi:hypothetical protein